MNWEDIRMECKHRGILDYEGNYITKASPKEKERHEKMGRYMKQNNITYDDVLAFIDLSKMDSSFRTEFAKMIEKF